MGKRSKKNDDDDDVAMEDPSETSEEEEAAPPRRSRSSRRAATNQQYKESKDDDDDDDESDQEESSSAAHGEDEDDTESEEAPVRRRRQPKRSSSKSRSPPGSSSDDNNNNNSDSGKRRSGRSNKFKASMKVPGESLRELYAADENDEDIDSRPKKKKKAPPKQTQKAASKKAPNSKRQAPPASPLKSRAQHSTRRKTPSKSVLEVGADDEENDSDAYMEEEPYSDEEDHGPDDEDDETLKIQRILAVRSETKKKWREICANMQTSEVTDGSRWFQTEEESHGSGEHDNDGSETGDNVLEERFLVKWNQLSYLHVSWETHHDLMDQVENAKNYMSTFFRKQVGGLLFTQDERKDGDYFDPGMIQIDRILEVVAPEDYLQSKLPKTWMEELDMGDPVEEFGMVLDNKKDPKAFEANAGRQFLIKWSSLNYSDSSYEFERDLWLMDQKDSLMDKLRDYYHRTKRPTRKQLHARSKEAEEAKRKAYLFLGDNSRLAGDVKEARVKSYQESLTKHVFKNGGSLRDYQAEGVTWFLANYVNGRSCIMADEMGLGKTLQTAAFCNLLVQKMFKTGPFLICVPLSTLAHWQREFQGWTDLNTIVYHGSAEDRRAIREAEFAYARDRPDGSGGGGINSLYLKKCEPAKSKSSAKWMATVVVTTPEMLVADDWTELSYVRWQVLVVDEAHRLKNHNSKLAATMRKEQFTFEHKLLLTGTPIQNDVKEFWTLLHFIDPKNYDDLDAFMDEYGDMKSKEKIDELHNQIRPYILRRLKEDVEKSVPPKEETLIEVELTLAQKQYYRALYEKNVGFLHKNKKKALDGPSLNNLAMQLRKCCNHLFLLNGVEDDMRTKELEKLKGSEKSIDEGDFVTNGSGKLVLLDKLLPRLKENGHRILVFSQFKIMLDILEDYLHYRAYKFERIDGSITGHKRQSAIDRFQEGTPGKEPPFVMLLSTRAGGVGINLTAADTCVIFDSDWNPQNDIQAMARCHRIGQTKSVKVYRLLTRKTYEMQMFHMSSLKMGLDQAVLTGFESNSSGEGTMTKEEVERLLRHGAYDIFNEDKAGSAEAESNDFVQQDIDSILSRRSRKIVHGNTGSGSSAAGGTFSKASFVHKTPSKEGEQGASADIDINDPDFWTKMVGEAKPEEESILKPRKRNQANYNEKNWDKNLQKALKYDSEFSDSDDDDDDESAEGDVQERTRWGGPKPEHWKRDQVEAVVARIEKCGYGLIPPDEFAKGLPKGFGKFPKEEILRMSWSLVLMAICEVATSNGVGEAKRSKLRAERKRDTEGGDGEGGLAEQSNEATVTPKSTGEMKEICFKRLWESHSSWAAKALGDAVSFARIHDPRVDDSSDNQEKKIREVFKNQLWPSLQGRGWKIEDEDDEDGMETYIYGKREFSSPSIVMNEVIRIHPELQKNVVELLNMIEQSRLQIDQQMDHQKAQDLALTASNVTLKNLQNLLERYSPMQILYDRSRKANRISLRLKLLVSCNYIKTAIAIVTAVDKESSASNIEIPTGDDKLCDVLGVDARSGLPHPLWTKKHDAILIRSVAKHGWVDVDANLKNIVNDKKIKWGFPFEASNNAPVQRIGEQEMKNMRETAGRAASILNEKPKILEILTGFNKKLGRCATAIDIFSFNYSVFLPKVAHMLCALVFLFFKVIDSYGLTQQSEDDENDEMDDGEKKWRVDNRMLHQASKKSEPVKEAVDLPAKKDFVKRAKIVIQKTFAKLRSEGTNSKSISSTKAIDEDVKSNESHGYIVIDQGSRCNILLAEMIRALVKGSTKVSVQIRHMWQMSHMEAKALIKMLESQSDKKKEVEELNRITGQIALAKWACSKRSTTQGKNVLRVMLGEKPQVPRNETIQDKIFPAEKTVPIPGTRTKAPGKRKVKRNDPAIGERAIMKAMKKAHDHNSGKVFGFVKTNEDLGIQLTLIESYILSVFCCEGIPLNFDLDSKKSDLGISKTWEDISKSLVDLARQQQDHAKEVTVLCKAALSKGTSQNLEEKQIKMLAENLSRAESDFAVKEEAARLVNDFTHKPNERLSKKSIMLMEKVRAYGTAKVSTGKVTTKYENYLGPKIPRWFGKELARAAATHEILDDENKPQSWTTADISETIQNNPEYNKSIVSAFLDKTSARQVTSQISMLSRLRSILVQCSEKEFRSKLSRAIRQSKRNDDDWEKKPSWWEDSTEEHSFLLLTKLSEYGFAKIMTAVKARDGFGAAGEDYDNMTALKLTKPSIQTRANQLVRELHAIEDHESMLQMVAKRRKSSQGKIDSLAVLGKSGKTGSGLKNPSPTNGSSSTTPTSGGKSKKGTVQTGLKAFFSATPSSSGKKKTSNAVDNGSTGSSNHNPSSVESKKRKESATPSPPTFVIRSSSGSGSSNHECENGAVTPPAEKKLKSTSDDDSSSIENPMVEVEQSNGVEVVVID
ncbi:unnamed protein product [Pseudo-nitzschia multistriata]|uniref:Uncharacterized protein n=1 Tax=Pseudo-nitzschia multistriata TaxID=183589 RepID=A0A448YYQ8_9STRA|nr:unnamed protein product [Pseudo-nitzschia multistriata]